MRVLSAAEQSFDSSLALSKGEAEVEENHSHFVTFMLSLSFARVTWLSFQYLAIALTKQRSDQDPLSSQDFCKCGPEHSQTSVLTLIVSFKSVIFVE